MQDSELKLFSQKRERGTAIQGLRILVDYRSIPKEVYVSRSVIHGAETFQWIDEMCENKNVPYVDSAALIEAFFAVQSADEAEQFLKASGPFRSDAISVTWEMFRKWQAYFKLQRRLGAAGKGWGAPPEHNDKDLLDRLVRVPKIEPLKTPGGVPLLAARAFCAVEAIAAALYIERWSNTVILSCRQCGDPFPPKTKASFCCKHSCARAYWRANGRTSDRKGGARAKAAR